MLKKIITPFLISILQIVILVILHSIAYKIFPVQHRSIGLGITILYSTIVFFVTITIFNFYLSFKKRNFYVLGILLLSISSILPFLTFSYRPLRMIYLDFLFFFGFISSLVIQKIINFKEFKRIIKWTTISAAILIAIFIFSFSYFIKDLQKHFLAPELITEIEELKSNSKELPEQFYALYDTQFPNSTTNSVYEQIIRSIIIDNTEGCTCTKLAIRLGFREISIGLQRGKGNIAIGKYLYDEYGGKICLDMLMYKYDFVNNQKGIDNAAKFYFNKPLKNLTTKELATLVIMTRNPSLYNPRRRPKRVEKATNELLEQFNSTQ